MNHWMIQGGARYPPPPRGPNSFIFVQFSAQKMRNNRLAHPLWELAHAPKENLGSVTVNKLNKSDLTKIWFICVFAR